MTLDKKQGIAIVAVFLLVFSAAFSAATGLHTIKFARAYSPYIPHYSSIYILGNGTVEPATASIRHIDDRYILTNDVYGGIAVQRSDIVIDGNGHKMYGYLGTGTGLFLQNVANVTVQNLDTLYFDYGIYLDNATSSTLKNNTLADGGIGLFRSNNNSIIGSTAGRIISVEFSNNTTVRGNRASGVSVTWSHDVTIGNNSLSDAKLANATSTSGAYTEGISIDNSINCSIFDNTVERKGLGVDIWYSTNLTFTGNTLMGNQFGFKILGNDMQMYLQSIDTTNTVNGKSVYFLVNAKNYQVPNDAGWIAAINSSGIVVQGWTATPNWDGILFAYTSDSKIANSNLKDNFNALRLSNSSNCVIAQNTLSNNQYTALLLEDASNNTITQNNIMNNFSFFDIWHSSLNNNIYHNNFVGNWTGSVDKNLNSTWSSSNEGNYWSCFTGVDRDGNGISDAPFLIDTYSGEKDLYPRMTPYGDGIVNPNQTQAQAELFLAMPEEYINYTITSANGELWAKIDGMYPMHIVSGYGQALSLVYPIPPNTTNIHVKLDGTELATRNYSDIDSTAIHYTDIGNWQMIYCSTNITSQDFLLEIHYEHPVETINGSYTFLYDLNVLPYLSSSSVNSVAHFTIRLEGDLPNLNVYTTGFTGTWTPQRYGSITDAAVKTATFDIVSEYGKPLLGDIVFVLSNPTVPEISTWASLLILITLTAASLVLKRHKNKLSA